MKSIKEVAEIFNVSRQTIHAWIKKGAIKAIKIGGTVRISDEEIERVKKGK